MERDFEFHTSETIEFAAEKLFNQLSNPNIKDTESFLGYDSEFTNGRISLIQLATKTRCYLFHVHGMTTLPKSLKKILKSESIIKIGYGTSQDISIMYDTFDIILNLFDLKHILSLIGSKNWSLADATHHYCGYELVKDLDIKGQWSKVTHIQKEYAARDAFACVDIWCAISPTIHNKTPSPLVVPKPSFNIDENTEIGAAVLWLDTLPPARSEEGIINVLRSSYGPWAKLDSKIKNDLAIKAARKAWSKRETLLPSTKSIDITRTAHNALLLLRSTHPNNVSRKRNKIVNQLTNSLSDLCTGIYTKEEKLNHAEAIINELIRNDYIKQINHLEIMLV